jgi:outer membrane protein TolC
MAIKNNPKVSVAQLLARAQHQVVRESRSAELPTANASITAEQAEDASRISAGSLTASRLFEHAGAGGDSPSSLQILEKRATLWRLPSCRRKRKMPVRWPPRKTS